MNNFPACVDVVDAGVVCVLSVMFPAVSNPAITVSGDQLTTNIRTHSAENSV